MTNLAPGQNTGLPGRQLDVTVTHGDIPAGMIIAAIALDEAGNASSEHPVCDRERPEILSGALILKNGQAGTTTFSVNLPAIPATITKIAITIDTGSATKPAIETLKTSIAGIAEITMPLSGRPENALILAEIYRRNGSWKFRNVSQGFTGGYGDLARAYGMNPTRPAPPAPASTPSAQSRVTTPPMSRSGTLQRPSLPPDILEKITLDKERPAISLDKQPGAGIDLRVNLNWNRAARKGLFIRNSAIDLDLGCLYELKNGDRGCVQALGNAFGALDHPPYIKLMGDDRTGDSLNGEWLHVNLDHWSKIRRVLLYAFIYEGTPNWKSTDAVITISTPGAPEIEIRMNEFSNRHHVCALALIENRNEKIDLSRQLRFFSGHHKMDRDYRWNMQWTHGSK